jgi:kynurenine formamidase
MIRYKLLSYPLGETTPVYGGKKSPTIKGLKLIKKGNSCNMSSVLLDNHSGTHIDGPLHFHESGRPMEKYDISDFIYSKPFVCSCPKAGAFLISQQDIKDCPDDADIIIIRTGYGKHRGSDRYWKENPGLSSEAAEWIRNKRPTLKAMGIDSISISSYKHRDEGRIAHKILLDPERPVFLIEDMDLSKDLKGLLKIFAAPLFIEGLDSLPATVIGEFSEYRQNKMNGGRKCY